ncbi:MAG: saccharopine dehydrogenase [candidate division Zixibacteria bacterium]|nr:saccharopine dehydrogenase [candidate division Zixibacteria bacterium]
MKNILVLGAGLVAKPLIDYLRKQPGFSVTIASYEISDAIKKIVGNTNGKVIRFDVNDIVKLDELVSVSDVVVSLLPFTLHVIVANSCIKYRKSMITTSYISDEMSDLNSEAKKAGILLLNEIGMDPGIDHMSAMRVIHDVRSRGGVIKSFRSYCGGLPAPEANDNPYGYKFSWSPRGVVMAGRHDGKYLENGKEVSIPGKDLFKNYYHLEIPTVGKLEAYPNRDSIQYIDTYGIKDTKTMYRGTLRNLGWCDTLRAIADLGYLNDTERPDSAGKSYAQFTSMLAGKEGSNAKDSACSLLNMKPDSDVIGRMEWLGLFDNNPLPKNQNNALDYLVDLMLLKMPYKEGERDMIVLFHDFVAEYPNGKKEGITSTLIDFRTPKGDSSMSRTVSLPAAVGTKLILEGRINLKGVHIPVAPEIYNPVLDELETMNIVCKEETKAL